MKKKKVLIIAAAVVAVLGLGASVTVTAENEYKLIRQFGKVKRVIDKPGISFRIPGIETAVTLPKETLLYDLAPSDVITRDKKTMISDSYVLWEISDPLKFAQTLNSSIESGESRINTAVYNATKNAISSLSQDEVITSRDGELADMVMKSVGKSMEQYGITLLDKEIAIQISEAEKQAEILKAEGEQEYMKILAQAYGEEDRSEFYSFVRSLDALKNSMKGEDKTVILSEDSPIAQIFEGK